MRVTKPSWVVHPDGKKPRTPLYSLHVHPDCSRLATGGIDAKIRIWSTLPILSQEAADNEANPRLLCTLGTHNGAVLTVRWAHHGRYLASGSDDGIVLIWNLDPFGGGKVFGSDDVNVENWKPLKRLVGHASDVADLAWNKDDSMIASAGMDSTIFIWDGYTFDLIRKIEGHQGFVKGVCWDPVGEYLATQSDDKTVRVWKTDDWTCEQVVSKPFERSPGNTFFRRLSWSPDGAFIAASNAMNGPIFVAQVIERHAWNSDISFVGHENTVEVAAFGPLLCLPTREGAMPSCMLALGADDNSISVWSNSDAAPRVVLRDVFERQVLDLCWSADGLSVYGCSSDGTILAINFDKAELPDLGTIEDTEKALATYAWKPAKPLVRKENVRFNENLAGSSVLSSAPSTQGSINILTARKRGQPSTRQLNGQRRIQPQQEKPMNGMGIAGPSRPSITQRKVSSAVEAFAAAVEQPLENDSQRIYSRDQIVQDAARAFNSDDDDPNRGQKRKPSGEWSPQNRQVRPRTLGGGERTRDTGPVREIRPPMHSIPHGMTITSASNMRLPIPAVQTMIRVQADDDDSLVAEGENAEDGGPSKIAYIQRNTTQWLDFPSRAVVGLAISGFGMICALEGGNVAIYSAAGVRLIPYSKLDSPVSYVHAFSHYAMAITSSGMMYAWNMMTRKALFAPVSMLQLVQSGIEGGTENETIHQASIRSNGTPLIQLSSGAAYAYDIELQVFVEICSTWWAEHSPYWTRTRASNVSSKNVIAYLETSLNTLRPDIVAAAEAAGGRTKPKWWDDAIPLGHLETRLHACTLLHSPSEYKTFLTTYIRKIADEGYKNKAEQLARDLYGPVTYGAANHASYSPTVCGLSKKDLLKEALIAFGKTRSLAEVASVWQERLKLSASEA